MQDLHEHVHIINWYKISWCHYFAARRMEQTKILCNIRNFLWFILTLISTLISTLTPDNTLPYTHEALGSFSFHRLMLVLLTKVKKTKPLSSSWIISHFDNIWNDLRWCIFRFQTMHEIKGLLENFDLWYFIDQARGQRSMLVVGVAAIM